MKNIVCRILSLATFALIIVPILNGCTGQKPAYLSITGKDGTKLFQKKRDIFMDYLVCSCLHQSLKKDSISLKDNSLETLYDLADDDLTINRKGKILDSIAHEYVAEGSKTTGETFENRRTPLFDCLSLYKSKRIKKIVDSLIRK